MKMEASTIGDTNAGMQQIQSQLEILTLQIQDIKKRKEVREELWCTKCRSEGQSKEQCPILRNYMVSGASNPLYVGSDLWCEICKTRGEHRLEDCYLLQKYVQTRRNLYCKFCKSIGNDKNNCWAYEVMMERGDDSYRMKVEEHGHEENR